MKALALLPCLVLAITMSCQVVRAGEPLGAEKVNDLRKQMRENFFVPDPLPALDAQTHRTFIPAPGVKAEAVSYATEFGTRVPAILYLPDPLPAGRIPAFIVVCGHGGDKYCWYSYYTGISFARGGCAVLTYDHTGDGERHIEHKSAARGHDQISGGPIIGRELAGLMITDVSQAVSYLSQRPEIDPGRIAAGGYSMGSFILALAGAVETRLKACVLVGGGNLDGPDGYWDRSGKKMCQAFPYQSLSFLGDRPAVIYALNAFRGPTLIFNGLGDNVISIPKNAQDFFADLRARASALHGSDHNVFDYDFAPAPASHRPYFLTRRPVLWLEKQIDFPNWTEDSIRAMPETHISEWAEKNHVLLDKLYATEEREGGCMALGDDVPGYDPESLNVFSRGEWEKVKKDYVMESWVAGAQKNAARVTATTREGGDLLTGH